MTADTLLFAFLRRKLGKVDDATADEFNAVLREWKALNGIGLPNVPKKEFHP